MEALAVAYFTAARAIIIIAFNLFTSDVYTNIGLKVLGLAGGVVTILVSFDGYRIATGASSEAVGAYILKYLKIVLLITVATTSTALNMEFQEFVLGIRDEIGRMVAGDAMVSENIYEMIIFKMGLVALISSLTSIVTTGLGGGHEVSMVLTIVASSIGSTLPIMVALVTSLLMEFSLRVAIMFAPICIFAGIFQSTASWPLTWAKYMFGIMLSSALMALMANICIGLMGTYAVSALGAYASGTAFITISMLSAVVGLFMSMLLISIPAVAAKIIGEVSEGAASNKLQGDLTGGSNRLQGYGNRNVGVSKAQAQKYTDIRQRGGSSS
jgi:hypothetical protein